MQMHVILMTVGIVVWFSSLASAQTVDAGVSRWSGELDDGIVGEAYAVHVSGRLPVCCDTPRPRIRLYAGFNAYPQDDGIVWDRLGGVSVRLSPPGWSVRTSKNSGTRPLTRASTRGLVNTGICSPTLSPFSFPSSLARELAARGRAARASASARPPEARPSPEKCRYCGVRHLCEEYWRPSTQRLLVTEAAEQHIFGDAQVVVESRHGPRSWDAHVEVSKSVPAGKPLLLRTKVEAPGFGVGDRVRVLDVQFARPEVDDVGSKEPVVATMGSTSEAFVIPGGA